MAAKKVIIINHGGQFGNQLWNYASVYAYCLEKGYDCRNPAFFHYARYFPKIKTGFLPKFFFGPLFGFFPKKRFSLNRLYDCYLKIRFGAKQLARAVKSSDKNGGMELFFLPPTENKIPRQAEELKAAENAAGDILFSGYAFRNPAGLLKYHDLLAGYFAPRS
ncbi:MAG: hypothetical protein PHE24_06005, partial [Patescibacteria group bacterium]|nr:hypothetical protein [Patescibacteria group bacterium]